VEEVGEAWSRQRGILLATGKLTAAVEADGAMATGKLAVAVEADDATVMGKLAAVVEADDATALELGEAKLLAWGHEDGG
jgi:hypothetical protein